MTLPEAFGKFLRTEATATIAEVGAANVFWCYETQNVSMPFVTFRQASARRMATHLTGAGQPREYTIEVLCIAPSQSDAWIVAEAVKADVDNFPKGLMPSTGTVRVHRCYVADESDLVSEEALARGQFAVSLTISITA